MLVFITFSIFPHTIKQQGYQKKPYLPYLICRLYVNLYLFACERLSLKENKKEVIVKYNETREHSPSPAKACLTKSLCCCCLTFTLINISVYVVTRCTGKK